MDKVFDIYTVVVSTIFLVYLLYQAVLYRVSLFRDEQGLWLEWLHHENEWGKSYTLHKLVPNPFYRER